MHPLVHRRFRHSRRSFLHQLRAAGLALVAVPLVPRLSRAAGDILLMTWAGWDVPEAMPSFVARHGGLPEFALMGSEEEGLQKIRAGFTPDLVHPCHYSIGRWRRSGLFRPLDSARLAHDADLFETLKAIPDSRDAAGTWFFPLEWGTSSVLFRTDLAPEYAGQENHSWKILFDPKYAGRLGMYDSFDAVIVAALVAGVADPFAMNEAELAEVKALLVEQRKLLRTYWTDFASIEQGLASGEVVASYAWPYWVASMQAAGVPVEYMLPQEGILTWACGLMVLKDHPGPEQAMVDLIDAMQSPEAGAWVLSSLGVGHANRKAFDRADPEILRSIGMADPETLFRQGVAFRAMDDTLRETYEKLLLEVKAGG